LNIQPQIKTINAKLLIGKRVKMCLAENKTPQLWKSFMPLRKQVSNVVSPELFSVSIYPDGMQMQDFTLQTEFEKWAAVEVSAIDLIPEEMEAFDLPGGLYAVFHYKGTPADYEPTFRYIFFEWLPASGYELDNRPHFEILGEKYRNNDPESEEDIWVPIRPKKL
jgi:AraC family transcriptional regulator